jgi:hypothetical protein
MYVGQQVADDLKTKVLENIERYRAGDFLDLEAAGDWRIPLSIEADVDLLGQLSTDDGADSEIRNSIDVGHSLSKLTPTLARENRLWIRLSHVDCLAYARSRWLDLDKDDEDLANSVAKHFFAPTLTGCRDDHAISRLWWNYRIARQILPSNPTRALKVILARADIRLNFLERPGLAARPVLARGVVRALEQTPELLGGEDLFRKFIKAVNLAGAGIAFEVWAESRVDQFMSDCLANAQDGAPAKATP